MTMSQNNIGKYIISGNLGIGEIVEVTQMGDQGEFYRVAFASSAAANFFSVTVQNKYRFLASKSHIEKAIEIFNKKNEEVSFGTSQEMINFYKKSMKASQIDELAKNLSILNGKNEIHTSIKKSFESALSSFVQEIEYVLQIKNIEAWKLLGLSKNNK